MSDPNSRARLKQVVDMFKAGHKREARRIIAEALQANPNDADAWYIAGQILEESPKKIKAYERALSLNPSHQAAGKALTDLHETHALLDSTRDDSDGLFDDYTESPAPSSSPQRPPLPQPTRVNYANPKIVAGIISGTFLVGIFLGALCLGTINSGRFLGIVFAPTAAPSKTPTVTPTLTPTRTPSPTQDIIATATAVASTQQYFDSTSTAQTLLGPQAMAETQAAAQVLQTVTISALFDQQIQTAIAATESAKRQLLPTPTSLADAGISVIPVESSYTKLNFFPIDTDYSAAMDRIIFVSANPNQLHIFNPNTAEDSIVELSRIPRSVAVGPNGLFAAVGHDAKISYVDLQNAQVLTTLDIVADVGEIALAGNGWIYVVPRRDQWQTVRAINISSNTEVEGDQIRAGDEIRLHPDGNRIYTATRGSSPADIARYDLVDSVPLHGWDSRYHGDYPTCDDLWFSADGSRIFTPCGTVFHSSVDFEEDMIYEGKLTGLSLMAYIVHVPSTGRIMGISANDNSLGVWDYDTYTLDTVYQLPEMVVNEKSLPVVGQSLFIDPLATHYYAIVQAGESNSEVFGLLVADLPR
jgi:hypothetical protein